jgi:aminocarboxymuconate-semialdehyde decarboxylase
MESIDIHFHVVPLEFLDAVRRGRFADAAEIERRGDTEKMIYHAPPGVAVEPDTTVRPTSYDVRLIREAMDRTGLDLAVLGPAPEIFFYWAAPETGDRISRALNDAIAAMVRANPGRFAGLATLPMQDVDRAARELERAVTELGLRGVEICTHVDGRDLDDPVFAPVFAAAERLRVPVFLHPQNWGDMRRLHDYHLWNLVGFPAETALAAARLILGGVFERHPNLTVILAHGGGYFPYQVGRLDRGYEVRAELRARLPRPPSTYLRHVYCDSLTHNGLSLRFLLDRVGDDHVVLGSDYPFGMADPTPVATIRRLGLGREREAKVLGQNLAGLLKLR